LNATLVLERAWGLRREVSFEGDLELGGPDEDVELGEYSEPVARVSWRDGRCILRAYGTRVEVASTIVRGTVELRHCDRFTIDHANRCQILLGELEDARRQLRHLDTVTERLTDSLLRPSLDRYLVRVARPAALLFVDLDRLKRINDVSGNQAGDRALCVIADRLRSEVAWPECLVRYGGEEFAIVLPRISREAALARAERMRIACKEPFSLLPPGRGDSSRVEVTVSIGLAMVGDDPSVAMRLADDNLGLAKNGGRDRVVG